MRKQIDNRTAQAIFKRDNFTCQYCGSVEKLSVDHIQPITKGGTDRTVNLITACLPCNIKKQNKILDNPPKPKRIKLKGRPHCTVKFRLEEQTHKAFKTAVTRIGLTMQEYLESAAIKAIGKKDALKGKN